jgi:dynein heavy chain
VVLLAAAQVPGADPAKYEEVGDLPRLLSVVTEYLADYNAQSKNRMDLVLFLFAAEHICRISRIIKQPYGNALLVRRRVAAAQRAKEATGRS